MQTMCPTVTSGDEVNRLIWVDTHAHLDARELQPLNAAATHGVRCVVIPAVECANFEMVQQLAHERGHGYALGIHPLYVPQATEADLQVLDDRLLALRHDPRLLAVGEIGLDFFVPALCTPDMRAKQMQFYRAQLQLAKRHGLPVLLHVRRSADALLRPLRELWSAEPGRKPPPGLAGIAHAFNGSDAQAQAWVDMGFCLGFGGAATFEAARQLRHLVATLPETALVLETDAPDMPPQWLYTTAERRAQGVPQGINTPAQLPRIGATLAELRGVTVEVLARMTTANAVTALPKLAALL